MTDASKPTVVLIHGAFADASGWSAVYRELTAQGYPVYAPANPLRGVAGDAGYVRAFVSAIDGPVVLAGHSYGGCVITNASAGVAAVKALVYVAAFAPDEGETLSDTFALGGGSTDLAKHLVTRPYPGAPDGDADGYIDSEHFHDLFCADVAPDLARFMAAAQRGFALSCLNEPSGVPGWRATPSWYMVAGNDATIPPEAERAMAARAGAVTAEVPSSHVAMISHPHEVTELIVAAANA
jgi:pimeloyl-ACP methyl ester carboxylesterase